MISSIGSAMTGMATAVAKLDRASARIAEADPAAPDADADPVRDRVDQLTAEHAFAANVATVRTADEMLGTLIDIVA